MLAEIEQTKKRVKKEYPKDWSNIRKDIFERDNGCVRCGDKEDRLTVHCIQDNGDFSKDNLITLCPHCLDLVKTLGLKTEYDIREWTDVTYGPAIELPADDWRRRVYGGKS